MTIADIKSTLSIATVLAHYGLEAGPTGSISCPFHDDRKSSMMIYPETNTAYCFAGSCDVDSVDVIDFIMHREKCDKRAAILRAKELCGGAISQPVAVNSPAEVLDVATIYTKGRESIKRHVDAKAYCTARGLAWKDGIGYKSRKTPERWGRGCIVFPLRDVAGEVVSLYGRAIKGSGHYYTANRRGLYPTYPAAGTERLLLTESVIDAAGLSELKDVSVMALYGTNGLTAEHRSAITQLEDLREIVLAMDGDNAGRSATKSLAEQLRELRPDIQLNYLPLPEGEDINSVVVKIKAMDGDIADLLGGVEEIERIRQEEAEPVTAVVVKDQDQPTALDKTNPHNLIYRSARATYAVKGGVRTAAKDLDSLKVTLAITEQSGKRSRQKLDLYEDKQITRTARAIAERLGLRTDLVELDLDVLTELLESYRDELRLTKSSATGPVGVAVAGPTRKRCLAFLRSPDLLKRINAEIERAGIVGEEHNRLLLFVVASSYTSEQPLHALLQGSSGSGKTRLMGVVSELMPEEVVKRYTRVTEGSLYNHGEYFLAHKLLCLEDLDGLREDALLAVRELQSRGIVTSSTSIKDELGNSDGGERTVRGPIASMSCTTKAQVYEDNVSRCFVVAVDESSEQSQRVIAYQNRRRAGKIDGEEERRVRSFLRNCVRLLEPLAVVNPYAERIALPEEAHKLRRLNELYQSFVGQVTVLNQYQRRRDDRGRVVSEVEDLRVACEVLFESIVLKVDELDGSLRQFFEGIKNYVGKKGESYAFNRFEVKAATGVSKTQQNHYLGRLVELEYLTKEGFANRGYRYKISHWDDQGALRSRIKEHLLDQLMSLETDRPG